MTRCYIFDLDGTVCDLSHRLHHIKSKPKDWPAFAAACGDDKPIQHICDLVRLCSQQHQVVFASGRNEAQRYATREWLRITFDGNLPIYRAPLYMRADGDFRDDAIVKSELLAAMRFDGYEPVMAFDDRDRVVAMWRAHGIPCAQVAPGDF